MSNAAPVYKRSWYNGVIRERDGSSKYIAEPSGSNHSKEKLKIHQPHDKGYKYLLSHKENFLELLCNFVNADWVQQLDEKNLKRLDTSYILADFQNKESDLVYQLQMGKQQVIFYVLMELQSSVDYQMPFRLLQYMMEIWKEHVKQTGKHAKKKGFRLPVVIPIVLYNGQGTWTACRTFKEILNEFDRFGQGLLDFEYILLDVNRYHPDTLLDMQNLMGSALLLDQRVDASELMARLSRLGDVMSQWDEVRFHMFKNWVKEIIGSGLKQEKREEISQILDQTNPQRVDQMIYSMEIALKEAIKKAKLEGELKGELKVLKVAKRLLDKGLKVNEVAEMTDLPIEKIKKLQT